MVEALVWLGTLVFAATGALKGVEKKGLYRVKLSRQGGA
jgi:hypothetical protein